MDFDQFAKEIKTKRLTGTWYQFVGTVNGKSVRLKGYRTWLQIYDVDDIRYDGPGDISVTQFNHRLKQPFN